MCSMPKRKDAGSCRKSPWRFVCLAAAAISGGWLAFYGAVQLLALRALEGEAASIGIIGGADGPTAVFITTKVGLDWDVALMAAVFLLGIVGFFLLRPRKK